MAWKRDDLKNVMTHARVIAREHGLIVKVAPTPHAGPGRLVVSIPKKIGSAPIRNRCRRRLRELFRTIFMPRYPSYDMVIIVRASCATKPYAELGDFFANLIVPTKPIPVTPVDQQNRP